MKRLSRFSKRTVLSAVGVSIVIGSLVIAALIWCNQQGQVPSSVTDVTERVSQHYLLPTDEQPALATVTDSSKLSTPFLKNAKNGDRVLIYQQNRKAIIYRPSIDRVVDVGPVVIDTPPKPSGQ